VLLYMPQGVLTRFREILPKLKTRWKARSHNA
jgi:hypothetical protein